MLKKLRLGGKAIVGDNVKGWNLSLAIGFNEARPLYFFSAG